MSKLFQTVIAGKRTLGWVTETESFGNILVVRRTPRTISVSTSKPAYNSINQSIEAQEAGWTLDDRLIRALRDAGCTRVAVWVPRSGVIYMTAATNYMKPTQYSLVLKNKTSGDRLRCVDLDKFTRHVYKPTSLRIAGSKTSSIATHRTAGP